VDDERGVVAHITAAGERMRQRVFAGHVDIVRTAFLDAVEPDELATLTAALERVVGRLRYGDALGAPRRDA
jgi:DNA-binding MarR family transcriptional regulator